MPESNRTSILKHVVECYRSEFSELQDAWKSTDAKAQGVAAVAALMVTVLVAFKENTALPTGPVFWILVVCLVSLSFAVVVALLAIRLRTVSRLPGGREASNLARDALANPGEVSDAILVGFYGEIEQLWETSVADVWKAYQSKTSLVEVSQWAIVVAVILLGLLVILKLGGL